MKLTNTLRGLIVENSRFQVLYNKYVVPTKKGKDGKPKKGAMDFDTLKRIIFADPTTRTPQNFDIEGASINDMDLVKVGKYVQWMLKIFSDKNPQQMQLPDNINPNSSEYKSSIAEYRRLFIEDLDHLKMLLKKYDRFKNNIVNKEDKDINKIQSVRELSQIPLKLSFVIKNDEGKVIEKGEELLGLEMYPEEGKKRVKRDKTQKANTKYDVPGAEILKVGSEYTLIRISDKGPLGGEAASYFGGYDGKLEKGESNWCTAARGSSYSHKYRQDGPLYIIIANDDNGKVGEVTGLPQERYQIHFPSNQFKYRDQYADNFPVVEYFNGKFSEFKDIIKHEFGKGFRNSGGDKVEINYPKDAAGTFVALYGFDEIFEAIPKDITYLWITNTTKEDIALDVPSSLAKFKNLKHLMLQNIVRTLPDNIGELSQLEYLALPDNKHLTSLPESLSNCDELVFISLIGNGSDIKIPAKLAEKLENEGGGFYVTI